MQRESFDTSEMDSLLAATCNFEFTGPAVYRKGSETVSTSTQFLEYFRGGGRACPRALCTVLVFLAGQAKAVQEH